MTKSWRELCAVLMALPLLGSLACSQSAEAPSPGSPDLAGTWAISDSDGGLFAVVIVDETGSLRELCRQEDFVNQGIDPLLIDGVPHTLAAGLTTTATSTLSQIEDQVFISLDWRAGAGGIILAHGEVTIAGTLFEAGVAAGSLIAHQFEPSGESILEFPFTAVRFSESPTSCLIDDSYEPNNVPEEAATVIPGTYGELLSLDSDWYRIIVKDDRRLAATVGYDSGLGYLDATLYDESGSQPISFSSFMQDAAQVIFPKAAGTYHLLVEGFTWNPQYSLTIEEILDDPLEENDYFEDAIALEAGEYDLISLDDDWFRVLGEAPTDQIEVSLQFDATAADLDLYLLDVQGCLLDESISSEGMESVSGNSATGEFLVFVTNYFGGQINYHMTVTFASE